MKEGISNNSYCVYVVKRHFNTRSNGAISTSTTLNDFIISCLE